jgi:L-threonylcarbamoyladenylate synthase
MKILDFTENNYQKILKETAEVIKRGGLVIFPSDTVYGLLVDPTNKVAVEKLLGFKDRWTGKAISVAVSDIKMAMRYVILDENGKNIYTNLLPGPFTIINKGKHKTVKGVEAENGTLGVRIPNFKAILDLVKILNKPVTVTSANLAGRKPNYSVESFLKQLSKKKKEMIDLIVDGGKLPKNKPSTVIDVTQSEIKVLRKGDLIAGKENKSLISKSEKETEKIADFLFKKQNKPIVFLLSGELGCGKTVFSRKIGYILGVKEKITSPTFVIYNEYETLTPYPFHLTGQGEKMMKFLHMDLYKITTERDLKEIKFLDLFEKNTIGCIEWPENMGRKYLNELKKQVNTFPISFSYVDEKTREIKY